MPSQSSSSSSSSPTIISRKMSSPLATADDRRKKQVQVMRQKSKARQEAALKVRLQQQQQQQQQQAQPPPPQSEPSSSSSSSSLQVTTNSVSSPLLSSASPAPSSSSPPVVMTSTPRRSTAYVSLRKREIIEKRRQHNHSHSCNTPNNSRSTPPSSTVEEDGNRNNNTTKHDQQKAMAEKEQSPITLVLPAGSRTTTTATTMSKAAVPQEDDSSNHTAQPPNMFEGSSGGPEQAHHVGNAARNGSVVDVSPQNDKDSSTTCNEQTSDDHRTDQQAVQEQQLPPQVDKELVTSSEKQPQSTATTTTTRTAAATDEAASASCWDTRSIHDVPPEPAVDPTWDAATNVKDLFAQQQQEYDNGNDDASVAIANKNGASLETRETTASLPTMERKDKEAPPPLSLDDKASDLHQPFQEFDCASSWPVAAATTTAPSSSSSSPLSFSNGNAFPTTDGDAQDKKTEPQAETSTLPAVNVDDDDEACQTANDQDDTAATTRAKPSGSDGHLTNGANHGSEPTNVVNPTLKQGDNEEKDAAPSADAGTKDDTLVAKQTLLEAQPTPMTSEKEQWQQQHPPTPTSPPSKQVDVSLDVQVGAAVTDCAIMAAHVDRVLKSAAAGSSVKDYSDGQLQEDGVPPEHNSYEQEHRATDDSHDIDFSATAFENLHILKDDEALLGSDQARSDVADGVNCESDAYGDAVRIMNQVQKQKRIEQYKEEADDDDSVDTDDDDKDDAQMEVNSEDDDDDIQYISADSEEEEELVKHGRPGPPIPDTIRDKSVEAATFVAAASAALEEQAGCNRATPTTVSSSNGNSGMQMENLETIDTHSSSSRSLKGDSTIMGSSVASSALFGAGLVSAGASVNTEVSGGSHGSDGQPIARGTSPTAQQTMTSPPPPPPSQPKKKGKKNSAKAAKPLLKIPPPPPEKIKKWEEQKTRPFKHLQAVAEAKAKSESTSPPKEAPASESISLSLITSVSSSHSHDEVETMIGKSVADEDIVAPSSLEREKKANSTLTDPNEVERSTCLDESHMTQKSQENSFPDARSVGATSTSASLLVMSPPLVSRTKLDEAAGLAPGEDGIWKEESVRKSPHAVKKAVSPLSDSKMAERFSLASSTAARKFEEKFPDVDEEAEAANETASGSEKLNTPMEQAPNQHERPDTSFFCAPDMLSGTSFCQPASNDSLDGTLLSHLSTQAKSWASSMDGKSGSDENLAGARQRALLDSSFDDTHHAGLELVGGAFSTWKNSDFAYGSDVGVQNSDGGKDSLDKAVNAATDQVVNEELRLLSWLETGVLTRSEPTELDKKWTQSPHCRAKLHALLSVDENFNALCRYASENAVPIKSFDHSSTPSDGASSEQFDDHQGLPTLHPFSIPTGSSRRTSSSVLAANFVCFVNRISLLSGVESPFKDENPFLMDVVSTSLLAGKRRSDKDATMAEEKTTQQLIFQHELGDVMAVVRFFFQACDPLASKEPTKDSSRVAKTTKTVPDGEEAAEPFEGMKNLYKIPAQSPSPFETASWNLPSIVAIVLGFVGDPVAVCRTKMINHFYNRLIEENEHVIMRDAVRLGGISMHIRPAFWMWITLEKCGRASTDTRVQAPGQDREANEGQPQCITTVLPQLEKQGREGKWHHVIQRDVTRAFGNMPPHKTGARLRTDSIVRALVTWGRGRVLSRGVKGGGVSPPTPVIPPPGNEKAKQKPRPATGPPPWETTDSLPEKEDGSAGPPETVSQWSGISPVPSFCSNSGISEKDSGSMVGRANLANGVSNALEKYPSGRMKNSRAIEELALSGNTLTAEMKEGLQNQLGYILHALAAAHENVGYCQGMDYVVAHLLRVLQDTVRWHSVRGTLSPVIKAQPAIPDTESDEQSLTKEIDQAIDSSLVVEETVFRVMDTFLTTYNLRHMYWPELRCLKTCCRVFERLIQLKLPVLADHFAYHDLNVGLFALGWFQTLFLYLPSMPSATVCHMWDIWLVERSFKIFFRVGTAILFLSQPILLNHELEGMMTYLNTFPDATLLNPDILIACALQIKVTNRMLAEIERDLTGGY